MEKVAPDIAYRRLKYVSDWRLVEENQRAALAAIVHGISRLDAGDAAGDGQTPQPHPRHPSSTPAGTVPRGPR